MAVAEYHVSRVDAFMQATEQCQLARLFPLVRTDGGVEYAADREGKDNTLTFEELGVDGKPTPGFWQSICGYSS